MQVQAVRQPNLSADTASKWRVGHRTEGQGFTGGRGSAEKLCPAQFLEKDSFSPPFSPFPASSPGKPRQEVRPAPRAPASTPRPRHASAEPWARAAAGNR